MSLSSDQISPEQFYREARRKRVHPSSITQEDLDQASLALEISEDLTDEAVDRYLGEEGLFQIAGELDEDYTVDELEEAYREHVMDDLNPGSGSIEQLHEGSREVRDELSNLEIIDQNY